MAEQCGTWPVGSKRNSICCSESRADDASPDTLLKVIRETSEKVENLVVVGHNPGLGDLALSLIGEGEPPANLPVSKATRRPPGWW